MQCGKLGGLSRSLLRYPGSKARFSSFIAETVILQKLPKTTFIEPFCGGASVSIALLEAGVVDEIVLNDLDPLVASLWNCVFTSKDDAKWLVGRVLRAPLTLEYWYRQKKLNPRNLKEAAFKCLYLNRTSFSGVLHNSAGPIGGLTQKNWTVGCRFNKEKIASRILELSDLSSGVRSVTQQPWFSVCKKWENRKGTFLYFDPPFYYKADRLYRHVFTKEDHSKLRARLLTVQAPWMLSYDNADEIRALYRLDKRLNVRIIDNTYSAHPMGGNSVIGRELVYANCALPAVATKVVDIHQGVSVRNYSRKSAQAGPRLTF